MLAGTVRASVSRGLSPGDKVGTVENGPVCDVTTNATELQHRRLNSAFLAPPRSMRDRAFKYGGRCVTPGFTDAHLHFVEWALRMQRLDLANTHCHADVLAAVAAHTPNEEWLLGSGWRQSLWPDGDPKPDHGALDAVTGNRPCALLAHDYHSLWLNGAALERLGTPEHAIVERDTSGAPTGIFRETASWDAWARIPAPSETTIDAAVTAAVAVAHAKGVTGVHDFQRSHGLASWLRLRARMRVWASVPADQLEAIVDIGLRSGFGDEWVQVGMVKAFADGTLGSRTAAMLEPFADAERGELLLSEDQLTDLSRSCGLAGLDFAVHAIGDRANRTILNALEATRDSWRATGRRPRIEHCQLLDPADLPRFAALGVTASMQPIHAPSDRPVALDAWGNRCDSAYAIGSLQRSGAALCFSSDAPIEPVDPLAGVHAAVTRDWPSTEAIGVEHALDGFWAGAARARHAEQWLGRLWPGYAADLVVLDRDPVTCLPEELAEIEVVATMVGGEVVFGSLS